MQQPLGDRLFDLAIGVCFAIWALGWVAVLTVMALQALFPKHKDAIEARFQALLKAVEPVTGPAFKYAGLTVLGLLAVHMAARLLGWIPPGPPPDPGDYDPHP
jgi:hypothetical protein